MTLPASGAISFGDVNTELGLSATAQISLNDAAVRGLFGIASGAIDMNTGHGKSNLPAAPTMGSAYKGGYFGGRIYDGVNYYDLVVSDKSVGESNTTWCTTETYTTGVTSHIKGNENSLRIYAQYVAGLSTHYAAQFCETLNSGGYSDWYMPSMDELEVLYYFLKPTTDANNLGGGVVRAMNSHAVAPEPVSTDYSSGTPGQTSVTAFRSGGAQSFYGPSGGSPYQHWASSEFSGSPAYGGELLDFQTGEQTYTAKWSTNRSVRAIRRALIKDPPTTIGQAYGGGFYAGKFAANGGSVATHYLIVSDKSAGDTSGLVWGPYQLNRNIYDHVDGDKNTHQLDSLGTMHAGAVFCKDLTTGGYTDWYLPSVYELEVMYYHLKPDTWTNWHPGSNGANPYAVSPEPVSTMYTSSVPGQTSIAAFQAGGAQCFEPKNYMCSDQYSASTSESVHFLDGGSHLGQDFYYLSDGRVRAIRKIPI